MNNGYPTSDNPKHSSYIKSMRECLEEGGLTVDLLVLDSSFRNRVQHMLHYLKFYIAILKFKRFQDYDFVYLNHYGHFGIPLLFKFRKIRRTLFHLHGQDLVTKSPIKKRLFSFLYPKLPTNTVFISPSKYFARTVAERFNVPIDSVLISPSGGVDTVTQTRQEVRYKKGDAVIRLGYACAMSHRKAIDLIVEFVGMKEQLEEELQLRIEFHYIYYGREKEKHAEALMAMNNTTQWPVLKSEEMSKFYNGIDVLLFPSRFESLGLVGLEAMSCEVPVIGTDGLAFKEYIVPGETGERFAMDDVHDFYKAIRRCIVNYDAYQPRRFVLENYSKTATAKSYRKYFEDLMA
jgi:glycosyltransferase involved in cell wall biosynthesis